MKGTKRSSIRHASTQTRPEPWQTVTSGTLPATAPTLLNEMTRDELRAWISRTRTALERKKARERAYLDRRAASGVHTATDVAYEADQALEADLLDMLNEFERVVALMQP